MALKGLKLDPNNSQGHVLLSDYYLVKGNYEKSLKEAKMAEKLDPLNPKTGCLVAEKHLQLQEFDKSIAAYKRVLELFPNYGFGWDGIGFAQFYSGKKEEALKSWKKLQELMGNDSLARFFTINDYDKSFRFWIAKAESETPQFCSNPSIIAQAFMLIGEKERALEYLEIALKYKNEDLPRIILKPGFIPLYDDIGFRNLIKQLDISFEF